MSMKGDKLRAVLEDMDLIVLRDSHNTFQVRTANMRAIALYDLSGDDQAFRWGWVEKRDGSGRTDCLSWVDFMTELQEQDYVETRVRR